MWGFFLTCDQAITQVPQRWMRKGKTMKTRTLIVAVLALPLLQGCTVLAIADVAASTVIYGVKTVVNVVDAVTPDIINKDKDKDKKKK
jgi:hypothetical protein